MASEFTGERVVPELVDADLLNEHLARYRFANRVIAGLGYPARVLDAGCGTGYGTAALSAATSAIGTDIAADAVDHARSRYRRAGVEYLQAACESLPFASASFDLVTAFEVIEHLDRWQELLAETDRVLKESGILLVSTPNKAYYAESRGHSGPNPFHRHEFDFAEFRNALGAVFPHVRMWTQNHAEAIVFAPESPAAGILEGPGSGDPGNAHFYLAACSQSPIPANDLFAWLPSSANVLQEREHHIAKLTGELEKKDAWLRQTLQAHSDLQAQHVTLTAELELQNNWAIERDREVAQRIARIDELQNEQEIRLAWIRELEGQLDRARNEIVRLNAESAELKQAATTEIARLNAEIAELRQEAAAIIERLRAEITGLRPEIERLRSKSAELEATATERTEWAQRLDAEIAGYRAELHRIGSSTWFRAGAKLRLGPGMRDSR